MPTVMTYNVHGCVGTDRRYDPERVIAVVRQVNPAIIGLQEVWNDTDNRQDLLDLFARELPDYEILFLKTLTDGRGDYGNALISRFRIVSHIDVDLSWPGCPQAVEARRAIFARLDVQGCPLWVIVTHLALEPGARKEQARVLTAAIDHHTRLESEPAVLMGDLNEWRYPNAFLRYLNRTFSRSIARRTFPSRFAVLPLDRIWMTEHVARHETWVHRSRLSRVASDHLPLCMSFSPSRSSENHARPLSCVPCSAVWQYFLFSS